MMEEKRKYKIAHEPRSEDTTATVQVVLWNRERTKICLVLDLGGEKSRNGKPYQKPAGWGNPTGKVHPFETPYEAAVRETEQETNHMRSTFRIGKMPVDLVSIPARNGEKAHRKVVFVGEIINPNEPLTDIPILDPAGPGKGVVERKWVAYDALPSVEEVTSADYRFFGNRMYTSHVRYMFTTKDEDL